MLRRTLALLISLSASTATASVTPADGWSATAVPSAAPGAFVGGMDFLPGGNVALFDGTSVVEVDPASGAVVQVLFTPNSLVFGSFVKTDPGGEFLLFGESSNQELIRIPLDGSPASVVTTITFNFDCAFESSHHALVSAAPGAFGTTDILRVDLASGTTDLIARLDGASGPVALDPQGNLYYGENSTRFPAPVGQQSVLRFSAAKVASAIGPSFLTNSDAQPFITGLTNPSDIVVDEEGDLFVSEGSEGSVRQYTPGGQPRDDVAFEGAFHSVGTLALFGTATPGRFRRRTSRTTPASSPRCRPTSSRSTTST